MKRWSCCDGRARRPLLTGFRSVAPAGQQDEDVAAQSAVAALGPRRQRGGQSQLFLVPDEHGALVPVERLHADAAVARLVHCQRLLPLRRHHLWLPFLPAAAAAAADATATAVAAAAAAETHDQGL